MMFFAGFFIGIIVSYICFRAAVRHYEPPQWIDYEGNGEEK